VADHGEYDPGYLGRYQRGQELPVAVRTLTANAPANPDAGPVLTIYRGDNPPVQVYQRVMACDLQGVAAGTFRLGVFLGQAFQAGHHLLVVRYPDGGGTSRVGVGSFDVLPGGSADGAVIALHPVERPSARFLVQQLDSGRLLRGRNPR
jgi:hypothetical protein